MGLYMFVNEEDRITKRNVSDVNLNEVFQEALKCDPSLMIEEYEHKPKRGFFSSWFDNRKNETRYSVYHETPAFDGAPYQARVQFSACGDKRTVTIYLHGIINGVFHYQSRLSNNQNKK